MSGLRFNLTHLNERYKTANTPLPLLNFPVLSDDFKMIIQLEFVCLKPVISVEQRITAPYLSLQEF